MWCEAMGRSRAISKIDGAVRYFCLSDQQLLAHSAHFHRVTRSRRANRTGFARESSARIETSELAAQLLVVYDYRGEDTENEDSGATARRCGAWPGLYIIYLFTRGGREGRGYSCSARPVLSRAGRYFTKPSAVSGAIYSMIQLCESD